MFRVSPVVCLVFSCRCLCGVVVVATMGFSQCFRVETKDFQVSVSDSGAIRWSEWNRKSRRAISLGRYGVVWVVNLATKLLSTNGEN